MVCRLSTLFSQNLVLSPKSNTEFIYLLGLNRYPREKRTIIAMILSITDVRILSLRKKEFTINELNGGLTLHFEILSSAS